MDETNKPFAPTSKQTENQIKQQVKTEVNKALEKQLEKKLHQKIFERTKASATYFKSEFQKQTITAITAAFAFLVALSWRDPIKQLVDTFILKAGLSEKAVYYQFLSALIITLLAVIVLILLSKKTIENK